MVSRRNQTLWDSIYNRDYNRKRAQKRNIHEKTISDGPSANLRPLFNSNVTKVSVIKWSHNWTRTLRSGVFGIAKDVKITCFSCIFQIFGYATPLLMVLVVLAVQFWDHRYFCHITIENWCQIYTRTIKKCLFEDILFLGAFPIVIPIVNSISNLDHEGVTLSCWNFLWLISAPKDTIKNLSRHVWMFWQKLICPNGVSPVDTIPSTN